MDPIEISVYILVTIIVGTLMLGLFTGWDYMKPYNAIREGLGAKESDRFQSIRADQVPAVVIEFYNAARMRDANDSKTFHLTGNGTYTKTEFFDAMKTLNMCGSIQSVSHGCGQSETFNRFDDIMLPGLAQVTYDGSLSLEAFS